jgi:hypothetical protein
MFDICFVEADLIYQGAPRYSSRKAGSPNVVLVPIREEPGLPMMIHATWIFRGTQRLFDNLSWAQGENG